MTAAYFEDHPTDPEKVILRKPYSTDCPNCEYHRQRAQRWREEAYKLSGYPLPEREWVGLTDEEIEALAKKHNGIFYDCDIEFARAIEAKLKDKNVQR
jgi:hypothetical protein